MQLLPSGALLGGHRRFTTLGRSTTGTGRARRKKAPEAGRAARGSTTQKMLRMASGPRDGRGRGGQPRTGGHPAGARLGSGPGVTRGGPNEATPAVWVPPPRPGSGGPTPSSSRPGPYGSRPGKGRPWAATGATTGAPAGRPNRGTTTAACRSRGTGAGGPGGTSPPGAPTLHLPSVCPPPGITDSPPKSCGPDPRRKRPGAPQRVASGL